MLAWLCHLFLALNLLQTVPAQSGEAKTELVPSNQAHKVSAPIALSYQRVGLFLAGMSDETGAAPVPVGDASGWKSFAEEMGGNWTHYEKQQLSKMREWAVEEIKEAQGSSPVVFYPFGGPDFLHAITFFPKTQTYILVGLEKPGSVPDVAHYTDAQLQRLYETIQKSLQTILRLSFFRTLEMDADLRTAEMKGTLPIVLLFMARTGCVVKDIQPIALGDDGKVLKGADLGKTKPMGYDVEFTGPQGDRKSLYYLSVNLEDSHLKAYPRFEAFVQQTGPVTTFIKSASYLMHMAEFGGIRKLILDHSNYVLEDDSGIPYRYFPTKGWNVTLYGSYEKPIQTFVRYTQEDLQKAFNASVKPLPVHIGYGENRKSNLIFAQRKKETPAPRS